jgi:hypothetical protein
MRSRERLLASTFRECDRASGVKLRKESELHDMETRYSLEVTDVLG